ncbi:hypothetical protein GUJ93_ZPchr0006g45228 [Zizania palustris]|uniref:DUF4228 domain-containing protein n=1 Tax=Zizania palustris TaxID=103762 RepID=A0A8J5W438_ZIZPA|nr:hypothetical protein GUJ93_ZPchr0006g45228 [Zizania palustris]
MGCGLSSAAGRLPPFDGVRVIHTNGYVEDFDGPVTVAHVTGKMADQQRYVLCSSAHLMQPGRGPFRPDDALQPGTVYFLLPQSIFQSESSAVDLACLMNRLTALASKGGAASTAGPNPIDALFSGRHHAPTQSSKPERHDHPTPSSGPDHRSCYARPAPWKPSLDSIDESIGRASTGSSSSRRGEA